MSEPLVDLLRDVEGGLRELLQSQQLQDPGVLTRVQNQLAELRGRGVQRRPRMAIVQPKGLTVALPIEEQVVWDTFLRYHNALLSYVGDTDDQGRLAVMTMATNLTAAFYNSNGGT